jgi:hypothetical protein
MLVYNYSMRLEVDQVNEAMPSSELALLRISPENASRVLDLCLDDSELEEVYRAIAALPEYDMSATPGIVGSCGDLFFHNFIQAYNRDEDNLFYAIAQGEANLKFAIRMCRQGDVSNQLREVRMLTAQNDNN